MTQFSPTAILRNGLRVLVPLSVVLTVYLYLFPVFSSCAFPLQPGNGSDVAETNAFHETARLHWPLNRNATNGTAVPSERFAPFRLLTLADPQLEGDSSIPDAFGGPFPHLRCFFKDLTFQSSHTSLRQRIRHAIHDFLDIFLEDIFNTIESMRKRVDLFGNDFYLAHIYRTLHWWTVPTHVTVLGDLLGSQWVDDAEFHRRADRYWNRVFRGSERLPDELALSPEDEYDLSGFLGGPQNNETEAWTRRILNVAGNHDIGYAGDINEERIARFEDAFGKSNYELRFELPIHNASILETIFDEQTNIESVRLLPELRIIVLNDMNLDTPAQSSELQDATYGFINGVINTATAVEYRGHFTLILTHVPLYKPEGVCVDSPFFDFHDHDGSLKEQNQLSEPASKGFVEGILGINADTLAPAGGTGRPGLILNGHDHEGCDTWHFMNQTYGQEPSERSWEVWRMRQARDDNLPGREGHPGVREITVRSMMGDFGGNAGLLSMWFDEEAWEWRYEFETCPLGTQHLWWLVHILDMLCVVGILLSTALWIASLAGVDVDKKILDGGAALIQCLGVDKRIDALKQRMAPKGGEKKKKEKDKSAKKDAPAVEKKEEVKAAVGNGNGNGAAKLQEPEIIEVSSRETSPR
ncbi:hypothetical protein GQ53DRAFT_753606 [Thozetella sp. PMI_491]|nr:hypothetical protein GQ53DRAFT_753606 [Thozetella sp. PMI_491]